MFLLSHNASALLLTVNCIAYCKLLQPFILPPMKAALKIRSVLSSSIAQGICT